MSSTGNQQPPANTQQQISSLFAKFAAQLKTDVSGIVKGIVNQFGVSLQNNPTPQNVTTSALLAEAQLVLSGPTLEKDGISQAGALLVQLSNSL